MHPADTHSFIRIRGARENNLRNVDLDLPKRRLTVFTGLSGSGKSSLVFDTVAAESRRLVNETYSAFVQGFMPSPQRPDVDLLEGLTTAIIVDQERMGSNPRSTVGTATDANSMLRILFSKAGSPSVGPANAFSFNLASVSGAGAVTIEQADGTTRKERRDFSAQGGMCVPCEGLGVVYDADLTQFYDAAKSLDEGAITIPGYKPGGWSVRYYAESGFVPADRPISEFTEQELHDFLYREPSKVKFRGINSTYEGLVPKTRKSMLSKDRASMQPHIREFVDRAFTYVSCPACGGTRLNESARSSLISGLSIADACAMQISDLLTWVRGLELPELDPLVNAIAHLLDALVDLGLGYLSLERASGSLSGGEAQRIKMVRQLGSPLTDVTYVFDEPTTGLHPHDIDRMNRLLLQLRDKGNTVLVVEHKPETIAIADLVVDVGPGPGSAGGEIVFTGTVAELGEAETPTGRHLHDRAQLKETVRAGDGTIEIRRASLHNLRDVDVDLPRGTLTAITGVAGSGKSSLIHGSLAGREGVVIVDQSAIRGSRRSNPATYTGLLEPVRKAFAKANGVKPALFSPNSEGACPACKGAGVIYSDVPTMAGVAVLCEVCEGRRFQAEVLDFTLGERNISEVLLMPAADALEFFTAAESAVPAAAKILRRLVDVGLGYIAIGQPLTTLSGGERQRLKLAVHMAGDGDTYVLDEPTTGLHLADVEAMLAMLDGLVDGGATVIVIEHHQAVMAHADWIVDVGPGAGHDGGTVVFEGTPAQLVAQAEAGSTASLTGTHLSEYVRA